MSDANADKLQVLSFVLDDECFGSEISNIQEVIEYKSVTKVPNTPKYMLGVINLRGQVIPVIDLRRYFGMTIRDNTVDTCIIIVDLKIDGESTPLGILADRVKEVVEYDMGEVQPPPKIGNKIDTRYIYGMLRSDEQLIILLRIALIFSKDELAEVIPDQSALAMEEGHEPS